MVRVRNSVIINVTVLPIHLVYQYSVNECVTSLWTSCFLALTVMVF